MGIREGHLPLIDNLTNSSRYRVCLSRGSRIIEFTRIKHFYDLPANRSSHAFWNIKSCYRSYMEPWGANHVGNLGYDTPPSSSLAKANMLGRLELTILIQQFTLTQKKPSALVDIEIFLVFPGYRRLVFICGLRG